MFPISVKDSFHRNATDFQNDPDSSRTCGNYRALKSAMLVADSVLQLDWHRMILCSLLSCYFQLSVGVVFLGFLALTWTVGFFSPAEAGSASVVVCEVRQRQPTAPTSPSSSSSPLLPPPVPVTTCSLLFGVPLTACQAAVQPPILWDMGEDGQPCGKAE